MFSSVKKVLRNDDNIRYNNSIEFYRKMEYYRDNVVPIYLILLK